MPISAKEQRQAAKEFVELWNDKGFDEKGETQSFWLSLLRDVYGVEKPEEFVEFEKRVKDGTTNFIDVYIPSTKVLIEQKARTKDLDKQIKQSNGLMQTPYQQAKRYVADLPVSQHPRWIITCNFQNFHVYDLENPTAEPLRIKLADLEKDAYLLNLLVERSDSLLQKETELSIKAGELVGRLYDELYKEYENPEKPESARALNMLCVRIVFCLYAEDAGLFGSRLQFHDYLKSVPVDYTRDALMKLFRVLDQKPEERDPYLSESLKVFPYVNGGLFADENVEIPRITPKIRDLLLANASEGFDWSQISPTIFGAVFESTLNPETRRKGGMHYTSIENIHKTIDPLFLEDLQEELIEIKAEQNVKERNARLAAFQEKLGSLTFFDPACGSGNFLTETYISLRKLENDALRTVYPNKTLFAADEKERIVKVSINQFYGIEINDFAVTVAKTALWIAESQMMRETEDVLQTTLQFLPLKSYANIVEGNALRLDWEEVFPKENASYIMGNPPFIGYSLQSAEQKKDMLTIYADEKGKPYKTAGKIDYVSCWYFKAAQYVKGTSVRAAFVSTNSITQGEQVASVWKPLYERFGIHIDFAYRTFRWDSEASLTAHVHCVIVGFSAAPSDKQKRIFEGETSFVVDNINAYLIDAPNVFIESKSSPICNVPEMRAGNRPTDGGHLFIEPDEIDSFLTKEPGAKPYIKRVIGAREYINNIPRFCLWLVNIEPSELRKMPSVMERVERVQKARLASPDRSVREKLAFTPWLFRETNNPKTYIVIPSVSSENRRYIPLGFLNSETIPTNLVLIIPNATLYHFGILTSSVHMAFMRAFCGRLEMRYRYSKDVVYNNFPWPDETPELNAEISATAQGILTARANYPESSLADLYDDLCMPPDLRKAHQANDAAVLRAYGLSVKASESEIVAELIKRYLALTADRA